MKIISLFVSLLIFVSVSANGANLRLESLIPAPQSVKVKSEKLVKPAKVVEKVNKHLKLPSDEAYKIDINSSRVLITAKSEKGIIWAKQTLRQLTDVNGYMPMVTIEDYPMFNIRGFMHDTGRNFIEIDMLKRHIDILSNYKLNVFHWHLTDYPAWRIECKVYPQLNDAQYQRKGRDEGKFYTYDEIRDLIAYAAERGVTIIPEIDMPGHSTYFNSTFGVAMASEEGMAILEKCLDEFFTEIPVEMCPYFHIGSDEIHISNPDEFIVWCEAIVEKNNRTGLVWNPGLEGSDKLIRHMWNPDIETNDDVAEKNYPIIDSYMGYLNFYNPLVFSDKVFLHNPCNTGKGSAKELGGILCLWNDVRVDDNMNIELHNGLMSGLLPFSERFWSGGSVGHVGNPAVNPSPSSEQGIALADFQDKISFHRDSIIDNAQIHFVASSGMEWDITVPAKRGTQLADMQTIKAWGGAIDLDELFIEKGIERGATMDCWATTYIDSDSAQTIEAWVGFEATARSNRISNGIGYQALWENDGRLIVNGEDVQPAKEWEKPGVNRFHFHTWARPEEEIVFENEEFYWMREPVTITLKEGRNEIKMYTPKVFAGQRWTFTFIPLATDGDKFIEPTGITFVNSK